MTIAALILAYGCAALATVQENNRAWLRRFGWAALAVTLAYAAGAQ